MYIAEAEDMAETVHLALTAADGTAIEGESTQTGLDREDQIECVSFTCGVALALAAGGGSLATGRRRWDPIVVRKRIDVASPLLAKAVVTNESVGGVFRFFRTDDTGTTEEFFTVEITEARVSSAKLVLPDALDPDTEQLPPLEEVGFVFNVISWTHVAGGTAFEDRIDIPR